MTSVLSAPPVATDRSPFAPASMSPVPRTASPAEVNDEGERERGRPRVRAGAGAKRDAGAIKTEPSLAEDADVKEGNSSNSEGPTRKRRRSRKGLDKKFDCTSDGCGKSYSRAEHLYRHQLNHDPKHIYRCDFPDCKREFVRLDLCNRHRDRHTAKGSALNRRDSMASQASPMTAGRPQFGPQESASPETGRPMSGHMYRGPTQPYQDGQTNPYTPISHTPPVFPDAAHRASGEYVPYAPYSGAPGPQSPTVGPGQSAHSHTAPYGVLSPVPNQHGYHGHPGSAPQLATVFPYTLPPSDFPAAAPAPVGHHDQSSYIAGGDGREYHQGPSQTNGDMMMFDQMPGQTTIPVFGSDSVLNKSPHVGMPEDFMAYLFASNSEANKSRMMPQYNSGYGGDFVGVNQYSIPYYGTGDLGYFPAGGPQQVMAVNNLLDQNVPESLISDEKAAAVFEYIYKRFKADEDGPVDDNRDAFVEGDREDDSHVLSRKMMQAYIFSYWVHFSDQMPIIHKPTFSPDKTDIPLLIAIMSIGAACLNKQQIGQTAAKAGAELSNFMAEHLRWACFRDKHFKPPAKLWAFQTLLLLELYEKMYSTRDLHERAHIHHATTITLMRRGRSFVGKTTLDSPPNAREESKGVNGSRHSSASGLAHTPDEWWNHWIINETTRRVAFAAFVIDSIHATMFGHSTVMVAHEMRLPLPCDDNLWKATSGAEVSRLESNMNATAGRPVPFLEGLKKTLAAQEVRTNSFGRMILMAGLLSVSWHMNQRDLQVNSLGAGTSLGNKDRWRTTLTKAFDLWKMDFDRFLHRDGMSSNPYSLEPVDRNDANAVFESRIVLHHLAHMAMHVDIVDCQIFARAKRLLGRAIGPQDLASAQRRMKDIWAPSAKARDAMFYALKFLHSVLASEEGGSPGSTSGSGDPDEPYSARDDVLLNRPWVLYFAALVVWCYGYALEGSCPNVVVPESKAERVQQMREYLNTYGGVQSPEELRNKTGLNNNSALLTVLRDTFVTTGWQLLHEGGALLSNCIQLNTVGAV